MNGTIKIVRSEILPTGAVADLDSMALRIERDVYALSFLSLIQNN